ncbi:MAG: translation elongation factor 4 [Patescibacteria group bacterium]
MNNIRNFCIIAHVDHGKSTLADRLLELTGTVEKRKMKEQILDSMDLERERGITIKLQPAQMLYTPKSGLTRTDADKVSVDHGNDSKLLYEDLTYKIRGAAFKIKKELGLGHKEKIYRNALAEEFRAQGIKFEMEKNIEVTYNGKKVGTYRPDFIVEGKTMIELKALDFIGNREIKQAWTYLKGSDYKLLLIINFSKLDVEFERLVYDTARNKPSSALSPRSPQEYILNLIDTPGHVDFSYEVSRSLAAVEGAILLVDATQGVQAQTLTNLYLALESNLEIIPVLNKIDLPAANIEKTRKELINLLGCQEHEIMMVSGKTGQGVSELLNRIIEKVPAPKGDRAAKLQALIFDSFYDEYKGVVAYVRIMNGKVSKNDEILLMNPQKKSEALDVGVLKPDMSATVELRAGDIGYIITGLKEIELCKVGDTITLAKNPAGNPLPGYKEVKPMVYAGIFCKEGSDFNDLREAIAKLKLNDAALVYEPENSPVLGLGFRCGFLGLLHLEIFQERLRREFNLDIIVTVPSVAFKIVLKPGVKMPKLKTEQIISKSEYVINNPNDLPDPTIYDQIQEPIMKVDIITPKDYIGNIMSLVQDKRGEYVNTEYIDEITVLLHYRMPLAKVIIDFYDQLKTVSSGYASMNYELDSYVSTDVVKLDILIAEEKVDAFSTIIYRDEAFREGKKIVQKLKESIPKQMFVIKLQAAIGGKIIAAERISALRKDVTAKLYGGDWTRRSKLLEKQKKGKKKMMSLGKGKVNIPPEAFIAVLKR